MKYKAIFLDLDGTTVTLGGTKPSDKVIAAIKKADLKINVCLATGRILKYTLPIIEELQLNGLCVIANGIQIYDPIKKAVIKEIPINEGDIDYVTEIMKKYTHDIRYFDGKIDKQFIPQTNRKEVLSLYLETVEKKIADKIITDLSMLPEVTAHRMNVTDQVGIIGLEVSHASATKQHGIYEVAKQLGIDTKEIIGVGDGYNDFPLLMACGLKVAMGNAVPELKAIADFIAPSVENDGVATVIEKFILSE